MAGLPAWPRQYVAMGNYRTRIYAQYATAFQGSNLEFDCAQAEAWGRAYGYYFRGWFPERKVASIVDLACGGGKLLYRLKQTHYTRLCGVDISPEQVHVARQVVPEVVEGDVLDFLAAHPAAFDLMAGLDIIEHFSKDEVLNFLDGCFSGLKPGGRLILQTPNAESPWGSAIRYGDFSHEVCFAPHSLAHLLTLCGFVAIEAREAGPVPWGYSLSSTLRYVLWRFVRLFMMAGNFVETGSPGSGIFTRVFLISATKPEAAV